ncbi:hypothetical protein [Gluconacetobacter johannae]|uniref:hypothetical protein n=1 Tax=Gluconacetobacter johannae TaxID=112140 RepID=UPI001FE9771B|nr:hypothetical protein [Gluconacetobacter johannae]
MVLFPTAAIYARKVGRLTDALNRPEERLEAAEALRALIEKVVLTPGPNRDEIDAMLYGEQGDDPDLDRAASHWKWFKTRTLPERCSRECRYQWLRG